MRVSIRVRLAAIFVGALLLVAGAVATTFVALQTQAADATVINLAGRQRMLIQGLTRSVDAILGSPSGLDHRAEIPELAEQFDSTLTALLNGGMVLYDNKGIALPATTEESIREQLLRMADTWAHFRQSLETVRTADVGSTAFLQAVEEIHSTAPSFLEEADQVVQSYEAAARSKVARVQAIQAAFAIAVLSLFIVGYVLVERTIVRPIGRLEQAAGRVAGGDLDTPLQISVASKEVWSLGQSFEHMRRALATSQHSLEQTAAELERRVQERTHQLAALFEVNAEIASRLEIQHVLERIVQKARELAGGDVAALCLPDPADGTWTVAATSGPVEALTAQPGKAVRDLLTNGVTLEAVVAHQKCECALLQPPFRRGHLVVPLRAKDRVLGMLCVGHREAGRFAEEHRYLLTLLADIGSIALENARLYEQVRHIAVLAERERIAAEIHDGLAQLLGFLALRLGAAREALDSEQWTQLPDHLALMQRTVGQADEEVRRLIARLHQSPRLPGTLGERLQQTAEQFAREQGLSVQVRIAAESVDTPEEVGEQVVRILQEALTNAHKHASGSQVAVTLEQDSGWAVLRVQDDGPGFDVDRVVADSSHFGLKVMRTRAEWIGGDLHIESAPGRGTTVTLRWPPGGRRR